MRQILIYIALSLVLLAGCRQTGTDSPRLVELDSLIAVAPDSAAALLQAMPTDSLPTANDRAYHALLLTQAKYKAYIPIHSLDTINHAVSHYTDGHDPDKHTRSVLYKGCVFEDMQVLDSAMYYYKLAEDIAAQAGDNYHRGYALMRMASLFQSRYAIREALEKSKAALPIFCTTGDKIWQLNATLSIAILFQTVDTDSSLFYSYQALKLSKETQLMRYGDCLTALASSCLLKNDFRSCASFAKSAVSNASNREFYFKSCHLAAQAYAKLNMPDSCEYYFDLAPAPCSYSDSVLFLRTKASVSGDSLFYMKKSGDMADTLVNVNTIVDLAEACKRYDKQKELSATKQKNQNALLLLSLAILFSLSAVIFLQIRKSHQKKQFSQSISDGEKKIEELKGHMDEYNALVSIKNSEIGELKTDNERKESVIAKQHARMAELTVLLTDLKQLIESQTQRISDSERAIKEFEQQLLTRDRILQQSERQLQDLMSLKQTMEAMSKERSENLAQIEHLRKRNAEQKSHVVAIIREMIQAATIYHQTLCSGYSHDAVVEHTKKYISPNFMSKLKALLNAVNPGVTEKLKDCGISDRDIDLMCLHLAGCSNQLICDFMDLTNNKTISNKTRVIRKKLSIDPSQLDLSI